MSPARGRAAKRRKLIWTARAQRDVESIGDFIARDNPAAARRWVAGLITLAAQAAAMPFVGREVPECGRGDLRERLKRTYRLIYLVTDSQVAVLAVFEGHRTLPGDLEPEE